MKIENKKFNIPTIFIVIFLIIWVALTYLFVSLGLMENSLIASIIFFIWFCLFFLFFGNFSRALRYLQIHSGKEFSKESIRNYLILLIAMPLLVFAVFFFFQFLEIK